MSRIGKKPVPIPDGVKVVVDGEKIRVEGPKGKLERTIVRNVPVKVEGGQVIVERNDDQRSSRANQGLMRALINNMVKGVHKGFERVLEISGVGYRAEKSGSDLLLHLGYSRPMKFSLPEGVEVEVDKPTRLVVRGIDLQAVGQAAAMIRSFKVPDPYKIKGVLYEGEQIKRKAGKKAVS
ncbi:MAG: 50S ribosomal protein L6 [Deltaproteobacteria bacterium]|nr:50S ribosomal protein L6 [Deltaproteobacteria bacterium]